MKRLIFCAVFGGYDRVYPPVTPEPGVDYVIVTDDPEMHVPGWTTHVVDMSAFPTPKAANLYHRALIHRVLPGYDASLYLDGNMRLLGPNKPLFDEVLASGAALGAYIHPLRSTVAEEVDAVVEVGKVGDAEAVRAELSEYVADGFPDNVRLVETTVIVKNHEHPGLDAAMELWWQCFSRYLARDQLSLPYVIWKTGLPVHHFAGSFRDPNPYFAWQPHYRAPGINPNYVHVSHRAHDSLAYRAALTVWDGWRSLRRKLPF